MRLHHERKSAGVGVYHKKKNSDGVRVDDEKKSDGEELTMRKRAIG